MRERFESLQQLRGVACLLVVAYHAGGLEAQFGLAVAPLHPFRYFGYAGVDLFFVLSGFIIASTCRADVGERRKLPAYLFRRAWRIYPAYWAALALTAGVFAALSPGTVFAPGWRAEVADTLFLLPQTPGPRILPAAWTLSYELLFYAAFGLLFLLPRRAAVPLLALWGASVLGCAATGATPANRFAALAASPFVLEFLAGCLLAWCPVKWTGRRAVTLFAVAVGWCAVGSAAAFDPDPGRLAYDVRTRVLVFGVPAALAVLALTGWERGGAGVRRGRLSAVGDASYSIYLTHGPLLLLAMYLSLRFDMSHTRAGHLRWLVLMAAAGVLPGLLFHRWVEAPLLRLGKCFGSRRLQPTPRPTLERTRERTGRNVVPHRVGLPRPLQRRSRHAG